ncbi:uncharacterized protein LOC128333821 [Hemicordylus capensis]|uniref:uncharacterized protein LOC128333821 n=1 Tax=Hemicordylus capensis TaxID=884348 RepID=UPI002302771F|nr:uncharacterized protein LOC128333821 [Hemicordylus capensis]
MPLPASNAPDPTNVGLFVGKPVLPFVIGLYTIQRLCTLGCSWDRTNKQNKAFSSSAGGLALHCQYTGKSYDIGSCPLIGHEEQEPDPALLKWLKQEDHRVCFAEWCIHGQQSLKSQLSVISRIEKITSVDPPLATFLLQLFLALATSLPDRVPDNRFTSMSHRWTHWSGRRKMMHRGLQGVIILISMGALQGTELQPKRYKMLSQISSF